MSPLDEINEIIELIRNGNSGEVVTQLENLMRRENFVTDYLNLQNNRGNTVLMLILARFRMNRRNNISRMVDKLLKSMTFKLILKTIRETLHFTSQREQDIVFMRMEPALTFNI